MVQSPFRVQSHMYISFIMHT